MERLGVDSGEAARAGGGTALAAASRRCLYCASAEICRHWLDERGEGEAFLPEVRNLDDDLDQELRCDFRVGSEGTRKWHHLLGQDRAE